MARRGECWSPAARPQPSSEAVPSPATPRTQQALQRLSENRIAPSGLTVLSVLAARNLDKLAEAEAVAEAAARPAAFAAAAHAASEGASSLPATARRNAGVQVRSCGESGEERVS